MRSREGESLVQSLGRVGPWDAPFALMKGSILAALLVVRVLSSLPLYRQEKHLRYFVQGHLASGQDSHPGCIPRVHAFHHSAPSTCYRQREMGRGGAESREPTTKRMYLHTGMGVRALQPLSSCWFLSLELPNWQQGARAPILAKLLQAAK